MVWPRSSAVLLKKVNMEVRMNSGQFLTKDLQKIKQIFQAIGVRIVGTSYNTDWLT